MKIKFKNKTDFKNLENYQVIGVGFGLDNSQFFLVANDNSQIVNPSLDVFEIIDNDLNEYERRDELNYGRKFFLEKKLSKLHKTTENYGFLDNPKKNFKYFEEKKYPISKWYMENVLDEERKLNHIEGL